MALAEASAQAAARDLEQALAARQTARQRAFAVEHAVAQRRAAASVLDAQHAFLDRVFARAEALADGATADSRYLDALPGQIAALQAYLGGRPATLRCRPELAARIRPLLGDRPQLELVVDETAPAGLIALAADGSCTIDGTLTARLAALRPQLEARLLAQAST
ncbi:MAG: hypothetical protein ACXWIG_16330 [Caldimonas sp.]